jgi:magnesium transporter
LTAPLTAFAGSDFLPAGGILAYSCSAAAGARHVALRARPTSVPARSPHRGDHLFRLHAKVSRKAGAPPGTLVHIGEQQIDQVRLTLINYDSSKLEEFQANTLDEALALCTGDRLTWLNIDGIHDVGLIGRLGKHFDIHPLTQEDILNTTHRPKFEEFDHYAYIVLKMLRFDSGTGRVLTEQVSLILTERVLISFQETRGDVFGPVRARLQKGRGRIRSAGCDYLAYALIDAVVDHYFAILEQIGIQIEALEDQTLSDPTPEVLKRIHTMKREILYLRKQIWPLREVVGTMAKDEPALITDETTIFLRDVHDHTIQIMETIDSQRDLLSGLLDLYMTGISNRMNEVMKVLTIIATMFIPITFIAGVYGMNFKHMPELDWPWGYGLIWCIMITMVIAMVVYFKKKKWL